MGKKQKNHKMFSPRSHLQGWLKKSRADFFFLPHQNVLFFFKRCTHCFAVHCLTPPQTHAHHSNPLTSIQTNKWCRADEKVRLEEGEKGWCLAFIIHTLVACSVTLFSPPPLTLSGLIECVETTR